MSITSLVSGYGALGGGMSAKHTNPENTVQVNSPASSIGAGGWVRNPSWLALPSMTAADEKIAILVAIWPDNSEVNISCNMSSYTGGNAYYAWGDGNITQAPSYYANVWHLYDYTSSAFANTDAPVSFTANSTLVTRVNHGIQEGYKVNFHNLSTNVAGVRTELDYFATNISSNTFQVTQGFNGNILPITFTANGTATLLPYKQAVLTIYPPANSHINQANIAKYIPIGQYYPSQLWGNTIYNMGSSLVTHLPYLDIALSLPYLGNIGNGTTDWDGSYIGNGINNFTHSPQRLRAGYLEKFVAYNLGSSSYLSFMFANSTFGNGSRLSYVDITIPSVANVKTAGMFQGVSSLQSVKLNNTANITSAPNMFQNCYALTSVSPLDLPLNTSFNQMFSGCYALTSAPAMTTSNGTVFSSCFASCYSLESVPSYDLSKATLLDTMFSGCYSLRQLPYFNFGSSFGANSMFLNCASLKSIPTGWDLSGLTWATSMFQGCNALQVIQMPLLNFPNLVGAQAMFQSCVALDAVPPMIIGANLAVNTAVTLNAMFNFCYAMSRVGEITFLNGNVDLSNMFNDNRGLDTIKITAPSNGTKISALLNTFNRCYMLDEVYFNTPGNILANGGTAVSTFATCMGLSAIYTNEPLDFSRTTAATTIFANTSPIRTFQMSGQRYSMTVGPWSLPLSEVQQNVSNLGRVILGNTAASTQVFGMSGTKNANAVVILANTVANSNVITITTNANLVVSNAIGSGWSFQCNAFGNIFGNISADVPTSTFTSTAHGMSPNTIIGFSSLGSSGGVKSDSLLTNWPYYLVNVTANTFQVANTANGTAITLTGNSVSNCSLCWAPQIISANSTAIVIDSYANATLTNAVVVMSKVDIRTATAKNWYVKMFG